MSDMPEIPVPLELHTEVVRPEWIDDNGHMNSAYYVLAFDEAGRSLFRYFGMSDEYRKTTRSGVFVGDYHIHYCREALEGEPLRFSHLLIDYDEKKVHYWQEMFHATKGCLLAQNEVVMLHVDLTSRKVAPFPPEIFARIKSVCEIHAKAPPPENLGHVIRIRRKESL